MQKKRKKKTYLGLETRSAPSPFSCSYCRGAAAAISAAAAVPAGVDEGGGVGRVDGGRCK